jgi:hypothetical protein
MDKKIEKVIKEAPLAYGIIVLMDYNEGRKSAEQIAEKWEEDKPKFIEVAKKLP